MRKFALSLLAAAAVAACAFGDAAHARTKSPSPSAGPITGDYAAFGEQMKRGAERRSPTSTPPAACWARS